MGESNAGASNPIAQSHGRAMNYLKGFVTKIYEGDLSDENCTFQSLPCALNIFWLTGHNANTLDSFFAGALGIEKTVPDAMQAQFGMGSKPSADCSGGPSIEEMIEVSCNALDKIAERLATTKDEELLVEFPDGTPAKMIAPTLDLFMHACVLHTSYHLGQVSMLRRAQGLPTGFGM